MPSPLEVVTDNTGRINHFVPADHPGVEVAPHEVGEHINGGERVLIKGVEYELTPNGSLVHPGVNIDGVVLGPGVRLDEGVVFHLGEQDGEGSQPPVTTIQSSARIKGTEIHPEVNIGGYTFSQARAIGNRTIVGSYVRIGTDVSIGSDVKIGDTTKIDMEAQISRGVTVGENVRIGFNTRVGHDAVIGDRSRIGVFAGAGPRGVNQDGPLILPRKVLPESTYLRD